RLLDLRVHPLAQVGVRAVPVVGQLREGFAELLDALAALLADEATLDHLLGDAMRDGHRADLPSCAQAGRRARSRGRRATRPSPAASSDARKWKRRTSRSAARCGRTSGSSPAEHTGGCAHEKGPDCPGPARIVPCAAPDFLLGYTRPVRWAASNDCIKTCLGQYGSRKPKLQAYSFDQASLAAKA